MFEPDKKTQKRFRHMSVCILTPCGAYHTHAKFTKHVANLISYSWMHGLKIYQMGITERMVVDWARNDLARTAISHINEYTGGKFTHLLWLDDDHVFNPDMAVRLASHNVDMVSAMYFGRTSPFLPVVYVKDNDPDPYKHYPLIIAPKTMFEVDAVGFGAMFMKANVFERVPEPWFTIDYRAGEDIAFCVKAKEHGVKIYCDGAYRMGHIGPPEIVTEAAYQAYQDTHPEEFSDKIKIEMNRTPG